MRACIGLGYNAFGIFNSADCICGSGPPTTVRSVDCAPCGGDILGYDCGAPAATSMYRDFNRVWEEPTCKSARVPHTAT
jgi:hypothetical protein